jgi:hypothetical protein
MSELSSILRQLGGAEISVLVRDSPACPDPGKPKYEQMSQLELVFTATGQNGKRQEHAVFVEYIAPRRRRPGHGACGSPTLEYFSCDGPLFVENGYELFLLTKVMEMIADVDPRVKGETGFPRARIVQVGNHAYDPVEMAGMYELVNESFGDMQRYHRSRGEHNWPFEQRRCG